MAEPDDTPTDAEVAEEEAGADDPELVQLAEAVPEVDEEDDDDLSGEDDAIDEGALEAEDYDPANDGDDSVLEEAFKERFEEFKDVVGGPGDG